MFGHQMKVVYGDVGVILDVINELDLPMLARNLSKYEVTRYTAMRHSKTLKQEQEWLARIETSDTDLLWGVYAYTTGTGMEPQLVGVTGLHRMNSVNMSCESGIVIFDTAWWGKGVATRAHLARTFYAATIAQRYTIRSTVREPNIASLKALVRVGYIVTGKTLRDCPGEPGEGFLNTHTLTWLNPYFLPITSPKGLTAEEAKGVRKAEAALKRAKEVVVLI